MKLKSFLLFALLGFSLVQCREFKKLNKEADIKFADQHFKTAITLIEMHKIRFGDYPRSLDSLKYKGGWDEAALSSVEYEKLDSGYVLDLHDKMGAAPGDLNYPDEFWKGLGVVRSNVK